MSGAPGAHSASGARLELAGIGKSFRGLRARGAMSARSAAHRRFSPKPKRSAIQGQTPAGRYITMIKSARP